MLSIFHRESTRFPEEYDIPDEIVNSNHSEAFSAFLYHWFEDSWNLTRHEVELDFLERLTVEESEYAKCLLRRNLHLKYTHIIGGLALLNDTSSVEELRRMFAEEEDASIRLTIAGSLWKLAKDPVFDESLYSMTEGGNAILKQAHFDQILWLSDHRSIEMLMNLLDDDDGFVRYLALSRLNMLEFERSFLLPEKEFPHQPEYYRARARTGGFIKMMVNHLCRYRESVTNGS